MIAGKEIVRYAVEAVRGTTPGSPSWQQIDLHGEGLRIQETRSAFEGRFSSTFPQLTKVIKTGHRAEGSFTTPIVAANAQALLEMGYKRTGGVLDSFTFQKKKGDAEQVSYTGCVCNQMVIRGGSNDDPVTVTHDLVAMSSTTASGITAGTYPTGVPFMGHKTVIEVNSVEVADLIDWDLTLANNLVIGPHGVDGWPRFIRDGYARWGVRIQQSFESAGWNTILRGATVVPIVFKLFTGVGTEQVTITLAECQVLEAPEEAGDQGDDVNQTLTAVAQKPSASDAAVFAYQTS